LATTRSRGDDIPALAALTPPSAPAYDRSTFTK
jgi:hypothetical protein